MDLFNHQMKEVLLTGPPIYQEQTWKGKPVANASLTSLPSLDAAQRQDVLLVRQELLHLVEWFLASHRELVPRLGPSQDLADGALREPQDIVSKDPLSNIVLDQLLFDLTCNFGRVNLLAFRGAASAFGLAGGRGHAVDIRALLQGA